MEEAHNSTTYPRQSGKDFALSTSLSAIGTGHDPESGEQLSGFGYAFYAGILILDVLPGDYSTPAKALRREGRTVVGRAKDHIHIATSAFHRWVDRQGGSNGRLVLNTTSDGREIALVSGRNGLKHILERHVPSYFSGELRGQGRDTLFPYGTTVSDVIDMAREAIRKKGDAVPANGPFSEVLRNGKAVTVEMVNNRVKSIYPAVADNDFGWNVEDIIRNWP